MAMFLARFFGRRRLPVWGRGRRNNQQLVEAQKAKAPEARRKEWTSQLFLATRREPTASPERVEPRRRPRQLFPWATKRQRRQGERQRKRKRQEQGQRQRELITPWNQTSPQSQSPRRSTTQHPPSAIARPQRGQQAGSLDPEQLATAASTPRAPPSSTLRHQCGGQAAQHPDQQDPHHRNRVKSMTPTGGHLRFSSGSLTQASVTETETELLPRYSALQFEAPEIDYSEWKTWMSPAQRANASKLMKKIEDKIRATRTQQPAGQWTRLERQHGRLNSMYPGNPWAKAVRDGVKFSLKYMPPQVPIPPYPSSGAQLTVLTDCLKLWFRQGVCRAITEQQHQEAKRGARSLRFLPIFVVKKPGKEDYHVYEKDSVTDKWRPCLNAKSLNVALRFAYFKQSNHIEIDATSEPGDLSTKTDVHSHFQILLYSTDPIDKDKFGLTTTSDMMCFHVPDELKCVAPYGAQAVTNTFGTSNAPWFSRQTYKPVLQDIRGRGIRLSNVCDDNMMNSQAARSPSTPLDDKKWRTASFFKALKDLEVVVDRHKYFGIPLSSKDVTESITPTKVKTMNGMDYHHDLRMKCWPPKKVRSVLKHLENVVELANNNQKVRLRSLASLLGKIESATQGLFGVHLFTDGTRAVVKNALADVKGAASKKDFLRLVPLTKRATHQLNYLLTDTFKSFNGRMMIHGSAIKYHMQTDWSSWGWGCWAKQPSGVTHTISVPLGPEWRQVWSGAGETWTAAQAIQALAEEHNWCDGLISLRMDNVAAVLYVNRMVARSPEINAVLMELVQFLRSRKLMVIASWMPGAEIMADSYSRPEASKPESIWEGSMDQDLYVTACERLLSPLGLERPAMDLFATHLNRKAPNFGSLHPNPGATWVNSIAHPWWALPPSLPQILYAFPPPFLLLPTIRKVVEEKQTALLVLPATPETPLEQLARAMVSPPLIVPWTDSTVAIPLADMMTPKQKVYNRGHWILAFVVISGSRSVIERSRTTSSMCYSNKCWDQNQVLLSGCGHSTTTSAKAIAWSQSLRASYMLNLQSNAT
jgi:hypothetical protein